MNTTSVAAPREETGTGVSGLKFRRRRNHAILLDTAWAKLLGVRKTAGVHQIRSNELELRLLLMQEVSGLNAPTPTRALTHEAIVSRHNLEVLVAPGKVIAR
ncbi:MAG: hypothetical protein QOH09_4051 [Pseudonocardiales bacterium]|jgi:hypothetical protein|nr:hypothetical protein [Pseudonocardiales bacterium]